MVIATIAMIFFILAQMLAEPPKQKQYSDDMNGFFNQYQEKVAVLRQREGEGLASNNNPMALVSDRVVNLALTFNITAAVHSRTEELIELVVGIASQDDLVDWLAILNVDYNLHISSIRIIASSDKNMLSVPELKLVKARGG